MELADGTRFAVGTGFSDAERGRPRRSGRSITFRYQELSDGGVPRFPSYVGVRDDVAPARRPPRPTGPGRRPGPGGHRPARRFELVEGTSAKFWEVAREGRP